MTIGIDLGDVWSHYCTLNEGVFSAILRNPATGGVSSTGYDDSGSFSVQLTKSPAGYAWRLMVSNARPVVHDSSNHCSNAPP